MIRLPAVALAAVLLVPSRLPGEALSLGKQGVSAAPAISGALVGSPVRGAPYAVWADSDNDGFVDGYVANGAYVPGTPPGYKPSIGRVALSGKPTVPIKAMGVTTAPRGGIKAPMIGAPVAGVPGAVWADINADAQVDGYVYKGQYYSGAPQRVPKPLP